MTSIGVFIPVASRGWLISSTAPATMPSFDFNRHIVQRAEHYGFDFALGMVKLRGYPGPSEFWVHNLESFTLLAGIAAVTKRIKLFASAPILLLPPAYVATMIATMDSIAPGRIGLNLVTGWLPKEYQQLGIELTGEHFARRYERAGEYATILNQLFETGRSDFKGEYYSYDDCRLSPRPAGPVTLVGAGMSPAGMDFVARHANYNFVGAMGVNDVAAARPLVAQVHAAAQRHGRDTRALQLLMVIADRTDELAWAKWEHYKQGTDVEAIAWQGAQGSADTKASSQSTSGTTQAALLDPEPTTILKLIGSYENVARMLDEVASTPGLEGIMLTFDDFIVGIEQFGEHIQPLMKCRDGLRGE